MRLSFSVLFREMRSTTGNLFPGLTSATTAVIAQPLPTKQRWCASHRIARKPSAFAKSAAYLYASTTFAFSTSTARRRYRVSYLAHLNVAMIRWRESYCFKRLT